MRIAKLGISGTKMVLLQGLYGQSLGFDRTHCPDACFNPTDCGEDRNTALDSGASNFDFVLSWSLARSENPNCFARRRLYGPLAMFCSSSTICRMFSKNHGSILVSSWSLLIVNPASSAYRI